MRGKINMKPINTKATMPPIYFSISLPKNIEDIKSKGIWMIGMLKIIPIIDRFNDRL
ncbi:MAG: hypothetical protein ACOC53_06470 [Candidatus Saliniplasma sp.]